MWLLFWDLPFTCIGSLGALLGKLLASDRVWRATHVWVSSLMQILFFPATEALCCFLPQLQARYRWVKAAVQGAMSNSGWGLWFIIKLICVHQTGRASHMCILIQHEVIWLVPLPSERALLALCYLPLLFPLITPAHKPELNSYWIAAQTTVPCESEIPHVYESWNFAMTKQ